MSGASDFVVIIIGSGLAGSCLANGLIRAGINVRVYERMAKDTKREGYQIRLGAAALKGLRACLSPEQLKMIVQKFGRASGLKAQAPVLYSAQFQELIDLTKFPSYGRSAPISRVVLRDALADPISNAGRLNYGKQYDRYEILNPGKAQEKVRVWFSDGSHDDCDILIAADGANSKINTHVGLENLKAVEGYTSIIAKQELPIQRFLELPPSLAFNPVMAFAEKKSLYFCAYLPEDMKESGKFDESLSSSFFGLHAPDEVWPADLAKLARVKQWDAVSAVLGSWAQEFHKIIDLVKDCDPYVYKGRYSVEPPRQWRSKVRSATQPELGHPRVWLVGDSMHAMLPNRGMGGNTALCDTATALASLEKLAVSASEQGYATSTELEQALKVYEDEMMPRAFEWVRKSGGGSIAPIDTSTIAGMIFVRLAAVVLTVVGWWYALKSCFTRTKQIDDAPELK